MDGALGVERRCAEVDFAVDSVGEKSVEGRHAAVERSANWATGLWTLSIGR